MTNDQSAGKSKLHTVAACAGVGAVGAFMLLGGWVGTIPAAVGGAALAGYAATRQDGVGEAARAVGDGVITAGSKAQELNEKHHITDKMRDVAVKAANKAKEVDDKYHVIDQVKDLGRVPREHRPRGVRSGVSARIESVLAPVSAWRSSIPCSQILGARSLT